MSEDPLNELLNDLPKASSPASTIPSAQDFPSPPPDEARGSLPDPEPLQPASSPEPEPSVPPTRHPSPGRRSRRTLSARQFQQRRDAARHATGPRTARGKARSRMNAVKSGVSGHARFLWESMIALGENPEEFQQWRTICTATSSAR
ncbi:MAG: hypothetical protein ACRD2O_14740 [Terriglobia bacterium]